MRVHFSERSISPAFQVFCLSWCWPCCVLLESLFPARSALHQRSSVGAEQQEQTGVSLCHGPSEARNRWTSPGLLPGVYHSFISIGSISLGAPTCKDLLGFRPLLPAYLPMPPRQGRGPPGTHAPPMLLQAGLRAVVFSTPCIHQIAPIHFLASRKLLRSQSLYAGAVNSLPHSQHRQGCFVFKVH